MEHEVNNDSDRDALMYYTIAHDKSRTNGERRTAKQMYEHKYGSIDEPFGWNPKLTVGMYSIGAVQPRPKAAVVAGCPRHPDTLRRRLVTQLDQNPIPGHAHRRDAGPSERRSEGDPVAREQPGALKLPHINRVVGQLLDRQRHGSGSRVRSRCS